MKFQHVQAQYEPNVVYGHADFAANLSEAQQTTLRQFYRNSDTFARNHTHSKARIEESEKCLRYMSVREYARQYIATRLLPSTPKAAIDELLAAFRALAMLSPDAEITLEANPGTVEAGKMTKDLALLVGPDQSWLSTMGFLDKISENLEAAMAS